MTLSWPTFSTVEDALKDKCEEIWGHIQSLVEVTNCSPQMGLSLALQILHWLPSIPWDLSYCEGIPMMFAYGPEPYELQTWGAAEDRGLHLDNHDQAANLLSDKLVHLNGGASSGRASPSGVTSPTGSTFIHILTSQILLQDSTSWDQPSKVPLPLSIQHSFPNSCARITSRIQWQRL